MDLSPAFVGLNDKERIFVECRLQGMSILASAHAAGVGDKDPKRSGELLEKKAHIAAALAKGRELSIQKTGYTREKVTEMLERAYFAAETATEMVMAARELGKLHGVYAPTQVKVDTKHTIDADTLKTMEGLKRLSTAELLRIAHTPTVDYIDGEFTEGTPLRLTDGRERDN